MVTHMVCYRVGAADESPGLSGIARFLAHLTLPAWRALGPPRRGVCHHV
jgi:predicted Zn-dependent peptidase